VLLSTAASGEADFGWRPQERDGLGSDTGPTLAVQRKDRYPHHLHPDIQRSLISVQMLLREYAAVKVSVPQRANAVNQIFPAGRAQGRVGVGPRCAGALGSGGVGRGCPPA
jgi:hypothetical protein